MDDGKWFGVPYDANGVAQIVAPKKLRMYLRWHSAEWQIVPRLVVTKYSQRHSRTNAKMMSRLSVIALWLFITFEAELDTK